MRFSSKTVGGYRVHAVTGTNTITFAIDASDADVENLLGFAVERSDPANNARFYINGFKVFPSVIPNPDKNTTVSTFNHPVQSFVWDDFTARDDHEYEYFFHPLKGPPSNLDRSAPAISIKVKTEKLFSDSEHDVFFNRGVASSQAYTRRFGNDPPDELKNPEERQEAFEWLSRKLDDAILSFIKKAKKGDTLLGCFYEFTYQPIADEFAKARERGVNVRLIVDGKVNAHKEDGVFVESSPREPNIRTLKKAKIPKSSYKLRESKPNNYAHNKFMVLLKGKKQTPTEVWTGSTNITNGGIHGQTNVGHWLRNPDIAARFESYWQLLETDPGPKKGANQATVRKLNKELREAVEQLGPVPAAIEDIPQGVTPVFSPRSGLDVLETYAKMIDEAEKLACITLAFGVGKVFKDALSDNTNKNHITFLLLEREDRPTEENKKTFVGLNATNNVYEAWGSYLRDPLYQWARETNARQLGFNRHVSYIHSKFLLMDPLGVDPIVVTGSANFSQASTNDNDENMLIIRGNTRVADIYFTEFNRLFFHYYFRSVQEATRRRLAEGAPRNDEHTLFLDETDGWTERYRAGTLRHKRVAILTEMKDTP